MNRNKELDEITIGLKKLTISKNIFYIDCNGKIHSQLNRSKISKGEINNMKITEYPEEFEKFCKTNNIKLPKIGTGNGKALYAMIITPNKYFTRNTTDYFCKRFNIKTKDSIQLFNKQSQRGIKQSNEKGKYYIIYPYSTSNKAMMRKDFKFNGTIEQKNEEINKIKNNIKENYIEVINEKWQLGHKNPDSTDNSSNNLVLQPPIQAKYRDNFIFIDTLTKIPTPKTLKNLIDRNKSPFTNDQLKDLRDYLNSLKL